MKKNFITLSIIITLIISLTGCSGSLASNSGLDTKPVSKTATYLDTVITITLYGQENEQYIDESFDLISKYESLFSNTIEDSDISRINANPFTPVKVDSDTIDLIEYGIKYGDESQGRFDITIGALSDLWNFHDNTGTDASLPTEEQISEALESVDYTKVTISEDDSTVTLNSDTAKIDMGGIAKGYIADKVKEYLNNKGITMGLLNLGGNILSLGPKASDTYTIGLQMPFSDDGHVIASIDITDQSVVTSGTYQRYFKKDGILYHHLLNTSTGYPIDNGLTAVTIISDKSVDGDALSTSVFAMGYEDGLDFVESLDNVEAIFIFEDNTIKASSGISSYNLVIRQ